jgi:hypothetical protein
MTDQQPANDNVKVGWFDNPMPICLGILTYRSGVPWDLVASSGIAGG